MTTIYRLTEYGDTMDFPTLEAAQDAARAAYQDETTLSVRGGTRIYDERGEQVGEVIDVYAKSHSARIYEQGEITDRIAYLPDDVAADQRAHDGQTVMVAIDGDVVPAVLRGDLYDLGGPGQGDAVVELA